MSATQANIDSGLSGNPSDDIDKQRGPASGSNAESPGNPLNAGTKPIKTDGSNSSNQGGNNVQQQNSNSGSK
jgi:hypothetical protein